MPRDRSHRDRGDKERGRKPPAEVAEQHYMENLHQQEKYIDDLNEEQTHWEGRLKNADSPNEKRKILETLVKSFREELSVVEEMNREAEALMELHQDKVAQDIREKIIAFSFRNIAKRQVINSKLERLILEIEKLE